MATQFSLPPFSPAKDPASYPYFKGKISRWMWRIYTQRLTRAGRWFAVATLIYVGYGGASLQLQGYVLAVYATVLWGIALLAMLMYRPKVKLTALLPDRVSVGETVRAEIRVTQLSRFRGADLVVLPHKLSAAIDAVPEDGVPLPDLRRKQEIKINVGLKCLRRGKQIVPGFRVETGFPFGILRARKVFYQPRTILVYPKFAALGRLNLPTGRRYQPGGVALVSKLGESFEYLGNREYREGDNVRDIDWRATARVQRPIVREWVEEYMLRVAVILDTHIPKKSDPSRAEEFERAVSVTAAVSDYMARLDYLVDLFAAGPNLYHLTAGRSLAYLDQILDILACVEHNPHEPFDLIEPQIAELLSRISTVICVFLDWNDSRRDFVQRISSQGVAVKVIVVRDEECTLDPSGEAIVIGTDEVDRGVDEF